MSDLYISKSKYCSAVQCPKMLWMHLYKKELFDDSVMNEAILQQGSDVGDLAMGLFGDYVEIPYDRPSVMIESTTEVLQSGAPVIAEASFSYNGLFCSVDILKVVDGAYEIYEVKSSTEIKGIYYHDVAYQNYVLQKLGYPVCGIYLVHINNGYIRDGDLDLDELFTVEDVTEDAAALFLDVEERVEMLKEYLALTDEPFMDISEACFDPYTCGYWGYCARHIPEHSIFNIARLFTRVKFDYYRRGIFSYEDLIGNVPLNEKQTRQVRAQLNDEPAEINLDAIRAFLKTLSYPLYFLDFETFQQAIPQYDGISPYMQIPFQYSLHILEDEEGPLFHEEFLAEAGTDPRRRLAEKLVSDIPDDCCVLAFNMGFEKGVINKLALQFPDLADHLMRIYGNMRDLMIPFQQQYYYDKAMKGSYSIKYVLPALFPDDPELDYHNLEGIHNGGEAMSAYAMLDGKTDEEIAEIRKQLLEYCKLDTYAMVKIHSKLRELA